MYPSFDKLAVMVISQPTDGGEPWGEALRGIFTMPDQQRPNLWVIVGNGPGLSLLRQQLAILGTPTEHWNLNRRVPTAMEVAHQIVQLENAGYRVEVWGLFGSQFHRWMAAAATLYGLQRGGHKVRMFKASEAGAEMRASKVAYALQKITGMYHRERGQQKKARDSQRKHRKNQDPRSGKQPRRGRDNAHQRDRKNANRTGNGHVYPAKAAGRNTGS
jgi:hypothetical protein